MTLTSMLSPAVHSEITPTGLSSSISEMWHRPVVPGVISTNSLWVCQVTSWLTTDGVRSEGLVGGRWELCMHACMEATRRMLTCAQPQAYPEQLHRLVILM